MNVNSFVAPAIAAGRPPLAARRRAAWLALPFDALRAQYAAAVKAGLVERSLLASARVDRLLASLERFTLGPWARSV